MDTRWEKVEAEGLWDIQGEVSKASALSLEVGAELGGRFEE